MLEVWSDRQILNTRMASENQRFLCKNGGVCVQSVREAGEDISSQTLYASFDAQACGDLHTCGSALRHARGETPNSFLNTLVKCSGFGYPTICAMRLMG